MESLSYSMFRHENDKAYSSVCFDRLEQRPTVTWARKTFPPAVVNDMRVFIDRVLQPMIDSNKPYTSKLQKYLIG